MNDTERCMPDRLFSQLLVADDDPSTREFLRGALTAMGFAVTLAEDGARALSLARARRFDGMLLDCRMPSGGAMEVLAALRSDSAAESRDAMAMATSAEVPAALRQTLADAGFACVIEKPCTIASLAYALGGTHDAGNDAPLLDDQAALKATGDASVLQALRSLFREDLTELIRELDALATSPSTLVERMHRLRSACGFCGATRLAAQAKTLQENLRETQWASPAALRRFRTELEQTLAALA